MFKCAIYLLQKVDKNFCEDPSTLTWILFICNKSQRLLRAQNNCLQVAVYCMQAMQAAQQHSSNAAKAKWCSQLWNFFEDISAPRTPINLSFAALEPCCQSASFAYNKPQLKDNKCLALRDRQHFLHIKRIQVRVLGSSHFFSLQLLYI